MINLLPPQYKEELQREERFRLVLILGLLLVVFLICLSLALLSIRVYVSGEIQAQQILVEAQREEGGELRLERMRELNSDIAGASSFYANRVLLSDVIERISAAFPSNVYLTSFAYTPVSQRGGKGAPAPAKAKIALAGFAPQTEDLLALRANLGQITLFKNFYFPPSNWIRAADINFSFEFEL
ncbi:MAG: hypothetical protein HYT49_03355 [Candidatus Wildermuthbacteria bacterium]|nr:hypothetical protein [Candidatus Wildermuthbacteria bacterium]